MAPVNLKLKMDDFTYYPLDNNCSLKHVVYPTETDFGISATIIADSKSSLSNLPQFVQQRIKDFITTQECRPVILQTSLPGSIFLPLDDDKNIFVLPHQCYLNILKFFKFDWERISSRLLRDCKEMATENSLMPVNDTVFFKGQGVASYRYELGPFERDVLYLIVQVNSKDNFIEIFFQLNMKINIEGVMLSPFPLSILSKDYDILENILTYKCKRAELLLV